MNSYTKYLINDLLSDSANILDIRSLHELLKEGFEVNKAIKEDGSTPLHLATAILSEEISLHAVKALIYHFANPNYPNKEGKTSMHIAASLGHKNVLQFLICNGGNILQSSLKGETSIDLAYLMDQHECLSYLSYLLDTEEYETSTKEDYVSFLWDRKLYEMTEDFTLGYLLDRSHSITRQLFMTQDSLFTEYPKIHQTDLEGSNNESLFLSSISASRNSSKGVKEDLSNLKISNNAVVDNDNYEENDIFQKSSVLDEGFIHPNNYQTLNTLNETLNKTHLPKDDCFNELDTTTQPSYSCEYCRSNNYTDQDYFAFSNLSDGIAFNSSYKAFDKTSFLQDDNFLVFDTITCNSSCQVDELYKNTTQDYFAFSNISNENVSNSFPYIALDKTNFLHKKNCRKLPTISCDSASNQEVHLSADTTQEYFTPLSSLKQTSETDSFVTVVEDYVYKDKENGIEFFERRFPGSIALSRSTSEQSSFHTLNNHQSKSDASENQENTIETLTSSIKNLSGRALRRKLKELGFDAGPVTPSTIRVLQKHYQLLRKRPKIVINQSVSVFQTYSKELERLCCNFSSDMSYYEDLDDKMAALFINPDPLSWWRNGIHKTCFNYLLLDPRITKNIPLRSRFSIGSEHFRTFLSAIFYVGKGSKTRPYSHLYEALKGNCKLIENRKIRKIKEIWDEDLGVVSLHVFQCTIPVEAWTREACMISAYGLHNLSNSIQGTFYGPASTWRKADQRKLGSFCLYQAFHIYLFEGERQIRPKDIPPPSWKN